MFAPASGLARDGPVAYSPCIDRCICIGRDALSRPCSANGPVKSPQCGLGTGIGRFMHCCNVKAGLSAERVYTGKAANAPYTTSTAGHGQTPRGQDNSSYAQRLLVDRLYVRSALRWRPVMGSDRYGQVLQDLSRALGRASGQDI
jgi:hypothetical protein